MFKTFKSGYLVGLIIVLQIIVSAAVMAGDMRPVRQEAMGKYDATHQIEVEWSEFANLTNDQTLVVDCGISAGERIRFIGFECVQPFGWALAPTNVTLSSVTAQFGTPDETAMFMSAQNCGTNAPTWYLAPAIGLQTVILTNVVGDTTNVYSVITGVTDTVSANLADFKLFNTATNIRVTITPETGKALSTAKYGHVRFLLRKNGPYGL